MDQVTYQRLLARCSTKRAPWWIVPSDHEWYRNLVVAGVLTDALEALDPQYPKPVLTPAEMRRLTI